MVQSQQEVNLICGDEAHHASDVMQIAIPVRQGERSCLDVTFASSH